MTHDRLINALVNTKNEAADDLLLEALRLGNKEEKSVALETLLQRKTTHGLGGVIGQYDSLPSNLQTQLLGEIKLLHHALREAGRSDKTATRLAAMKLIALGHQGKLAYVLSENLHEPEGTVAKAAVEAMVALARWAATETRALQRGRNAEEPARGETRDSREQRRSPSPTSDELALPQPTSAEIYRELLEQRPEIEQTIARAMDGHRGKYGPDLLRAALLLADWPQSKTLAILQSGKHGGQSAIVRRLQQPPASEHVEAFLLGASHGGLRSHFGVVFSHIEEAPVLDALLRKTHWLKDHALHNCVHLVTRGAWWGDAELARDITRRHPIDAARIAEWVVSSGVHDVVQDERLERLRQHAGNDYAARFRVFRTAAQRRRSTAFQLFKTYLNDPDERLVRMAAREIVRRRPSDLENILLQMMSTASDSVRRVIARSVGQTGFEQFWTNFDRLDKATRKQAGRAMFKLLPDAIQRLSRRLASPIPEQKLKALQVVQELKLADQVKDRLLALCNDPNARLRSKAVGVLGEAQTVAPEALIEKLLSDTDSRVRANTIEVLEVHHKSAFVPMLVQRARQGNNRERANAIRVLHRLRMSMFDSALKLMLADPRPEHRISAMWALKETGWWNLIGDVGQMAKTDENLRVRRYALAVLKAVSEMVRAQRKKTAG